MITLINFEPVTSGIYRCDFGVDAVADVASLPTTGDLSDYGLSSVKPAPWSMAIVAADKSMYYLNGSNVWTKIGG